MYFDLENYTAKSKLKILALDKTFLTKGLGIIWNITSQKADTTKLYGSIQYFCVNFHIT